MVRKCTYGSLKRVVAIQTVSISRKNESIEAGRQGAEPQDRRHSARIFMAEAIQYAVLHADGERSTSCGTLLNLSEGGIYFGTENRLGPGVSVEIVLPWPARGAMSTSVVLQGLVLRSDAVHAA